MQTIERYGVIVLLLCAVSIGAVWMWERDGSSTTQAAERDEAPRTARTEQVPRPETRSLERPKRDHDGVAVRAKASLTKETLEKLKQRSAKWLDEAGERLADLDDAPGGDGRPEVVPVNVTPEPEPEGQPVVEPVVTPVRTDPVGPRTDGGRVYVVAANDTLSEISLRELGTSKRWREIVELNPGLDPSRLRVGARLRMPDGGTSRPAPSGGGAAEEPAPATGRAQVRVAAGDSLWSIAERALGDGNRYKELLAQNPGLDPARLVVGQILNLPSGVEAPPARAREGRTVAKNSSRKGRVL